jgi:hypothetical protein
MYKEANPKPVLVAGLKGLVAAQLTALPAAAVAALSQLTPLCFARLWAMRLDVPQSL